MKIHKFLGYAACPILISIFLYRCGPGEGNRQNREDYIKYNQYLVEGKRLYLLHCSNCHQENGKGLGRLYPPLKDSDYLKNMDNLYKVVCSIKYGQSEVIIVNGISYNQPMPANPWLTDLEIAEIITYVYSTWGENEELFTHQKTGRILDSCNH
ncbi:MAG: cytochrome c [Cyclobacteriaceae bacterium]|nr:cytochrome c [Cyclobacteriaceae bacterium]